MRATKTGPRRRGARIHRARAARCHITKVAPIDPRAGCGLKMHSGTSRRTGPARWAGQSMAATADQLALAHAGGTLHIPGVRVSSVVTRPCRPIVGHRAGDSLRTPAPGVPTSRQDPGVVDTHRNILAPRPHSVTSPHHATPTSRRRKSEESTLGRRQPTPNPVGGNSKPASNQGRFRKIIAGPLCPERAPVVGGHASRGRDRHAFALVDFFIRNSALGPC